MLSVKYYRPETDTSRTRCFSRRKCSNLVNAIFAYQTTGLTRILSKKSVTFYPISLIWSRRLKTRIVLVLEMTTNPRVIICKFLYRPQRYKVIQKKRDLEDGIWVTEDLIWEDREAKKKLKEVMKEAFENGKKPRFALGKLYIDGALYRKT